MHDLSERRSTMQSMREHAAQPVVNRIPAGLPALILASALALPVLLGSTGPGSIPRYHEVEPMVTQVSRHATSAKLVDSNGHAVKLKAEQGEVSPPLLRPGSYRMTQTVLGVLPVRTHLAVGAWHGYVVLPYDVALAAAAVAAAAAAARWRPRYLSMMGLLAIAVAGASSSHAGALSGAGIVASSRLQSRSERIWVASSSAGYASLMWLAPAPGGMMSLGAAALVLFGSGRSTGRRIAASAAILAAAVNILSASASFEEPSPEQVSSCFDIPWGADDGSNPLLCVEEVMVRYGRQGRYEEAMQALSSALDGSGGIMVGANGTVCKHAEEALAEYSVRAGARPEALMNTSTLCFYSVQHGSAAAVALVAAEPETAIADLCTPAETAVLPPEIYVTQCWHGAGQGTARRHRLDLAASVETCGSTGEKAEAGNCFEGAVMEAIGHRNRSKDRKHAEEVLEVITASWCASMPEAMVSACFRYSGQLDAERRGWYAAATHLAAECPNMDGGEVREACWEAVGSASAYGIEHAGRSDLDARFSVCSEAPRDGAAPCFLRLVNSASGVAVSQKATAEDLLEHVPVDVRTLIERDVLAFQEDMLRAGGRGLGSERR